MVKIKWCLKQKKGIELIEPNENLSKSYMKEADETIEAMMINKGSWRIITAYYACYNALYSILMKAGVKCEIHDCTIELMRLIEGFEQKDLELMNNLKEKRINAQYYLKEVKLDNEDDIKEFILKCKKIIETLDREKIRTKLEGEKN